MCKQIKKHTLQKIQEGAKFAKSKSIFFSYSFFFKNIILAIWWYYTSSHCFHSTSLLHNDPVAREGSVLAFQLYTCAFFLLFLTRISRFLIREESVEKCILNTQCTKTNTRDTLAPAAPLYRVWWKTFFKTFLGNFDRSILGTQTCHSDHSLSWETASHPVNIRIFREQNSMYVGGQKATSTGWSDSSYSEQIPSSSCVLACGGSAGWHSIGTSLLLALFSEQIKKVGGSKKGNKMKGVFSLSVFPVTIQIPHFEVVDCLVFD